MMVFCSIFMFSVSFLIIVYVVFRIATNIMFARIRIEREGTNKFLENVISREIEGCLLKMCSVNSVTPTSAEKPKRPSRERRKRRRGATVHGSPEHTELLRKRKKEWWDKKRAEEALAKQLNASASD